MDSLEEYVINHSSCVVPRCEYVENNIEIECDECQKRIIAEHDAQIRADERAKTIDECFKAMRKKVDEVFQRQTEERHEKDLSAYQQPFDCFSMGTIELEILSEVENQMKEQK